MGDDLICIDISHYQSDPDWSSLIDEGVLGVILKCTEGTGYVDETFFERYVNAQAAGLAVGTYHFLRHGNAKGQMQWYLENLNPRIGERVVIDYEDDDCTLDDLREAVTALMNDERHLAVTVYGANGCLGFQLAGERDELLAQTSLWVASYTSAHTPTMSDLSATWPVWTLWQFTDCAFVDGFGPVDGNVFNGSDANFLAWLHPAITQPAKPSHETRLVVESGTLHLTVRKGATVIVVQE